MMKTEEWFYLGAPALPDSELDQEIILDATVDSLSSGRPASFYQACQDPDSNAAMYVFTVRGELHAHVLYRVNKDSRKIIDKCEWSHP